MTGNEKEHPAVDPGSRNESESLDDFERSLEAVHLAIVRGERVDDRLAGVRQKQSESSISDVLPCLEHLERARRRRCDPPSNESTFLSRFRIEHSVGEGSYGIVYAATDTQLNRRVALKIARPEVSLNPDLRRRFRHEAAMAARLEHRGIVSVFDIGEVDGILFIASELCEGLSLQEWMNRSEAPIPLDDIVDLTWQIATAIGHAHRRGVLHRDLKPANVLLVPREDLGPREDIETPSRLSDYVAKVGDFGLGRLEEDVQWTKTGSIVGTPAFMSPEQAAGRSEDLCTGSDIFSIGVMTYRLLTGRLPFGSTNAARLLVDIQDQHPTEPRVLRRDLTQDLNAICVRCLEKNPSDRYASGTELADDLDAYRRGLPVEARSLSGFALAWRWCQRRPITAAAIVGFASVITSLAIGSSLLANHLADQRDRIQANLDRAVDAETRLRETVATLEAKLYETSKQDQIAALNQVIETSPTADAHYQRGAHFWRIVDYDTAIRDFDAALAIHSRHPFAAADKAWILMIGGDKWRDDAAALELTDRFTNFNQENWSLASTRALALHRAGRYQDALPEMQRALRLRKATAAGPNASHHFQMAMILAKLGRRYEADQHYEVGLERIEATKFELPESEIETLRKEAANAISESRS